MLMNNLFLHDKGDWVGLFNSSTSNEVEIALFLIENLFSIKNPNAGKTARPGDSCCQSVNLIGARI